MSKWLDRVKQHPQPAPCDQLPKVPKALPASMSPAREACGFACLMQLPDGRKFWLAPDGMQFDAGCIPILRRSIMDKLTASGADIKIEVRKLIDTLHEFGGELCMPQG